LRISAIRSQGFTFFFLIILGVGIIYILFSQNKTVEPDLLANFTSRLKLNDVFIHFGQNGSEQWTLKAKQVNDLGQEQVMDEVIFNYVYNPKERFIVFSPKSIIRNGLGQVVLYPKVRILMNDLVAGCKQLVFERSKQLVEFKEDFFLQSKSLRIKAKWAQFDLQRNVFYAQGRVRCVIF